MAKRTNPKQSIEGEVVATSLPKFPKPKILAIDFDDGDLAALTSAGWNVATGTLGCPYYVPKSSVYVPVIATPSLPNFTEQEIVLLNLNRPSPSKTVDLNKRRATDEFGWFAKSHLGYIDPRPRTAGQIKGPFDRILNSGGVVVIFADADSDQDYVLARGDVGEIYDVREINASLWDFLSELGNFSIEADHGTEMQCTIDNNLLRAAIGKYFEGEFNFIVHPPSYSTDSSYILATSKYNDPIAVLRKCDPSGAIIVLPQLANTSEILVALIQQVIPEINPALYPFNNAASWTERTEYQISSITELKSRKEEVISKAQDDIKHLDSLIQDAKREHGWQHDLVTATDVALVSAVKKALSLLGFMNISDVDNERDLAGKSRREDLQIADRSPTLIVDIKGIGGHCSDDEALQADKHASIRMREWGRTDINGLTIINHQRHIPALDRDNNMPFRQEILDAASIHKLGLITTWDLFRLVRNFTRHQWQSKHVVPLFYQTGRIKCIPKNYQHIGTVAKAWTDKFGVIITEGEVGCGEQVAVEFPIEFELCLVTSLRVDDQSVSIAKVGDRAGFLWPHANLKLKEGMNVYRVS
jgi:hypothetical protein